MFGQKRNCIFEKKLANTEGSWLEHLASILGDLQRLKTC
jgi:hypothetical protein